MLVYSGAEKTKRVSETFQYRRDKNTLGNFTLSSFFCEDKTWNIHWFLSFFLKYSVSYTAWILIITYRPRRLEVDDA